MADNLVVSHLQYAHKIVFGARADKTGGARHPIGFAPLLMHAHFESRSRSPVWDPKV